MPENLTRREMLEKSILEVEQRIGRLDAELHDARRLHDASKDELARVREEPEQAQRDSRVADVPVQSSAAKIAMFRSLFRGRLDVFPRLWTNSRTGKRGYV